jgi:hypothetical protein
MLKDLELREEVLTKALEETKTELEEHKGKLQKYELEVVNLSNAEDKVASARSLMHALRACARPYPRRWRGVPSPPPHSHERALSQAHFVHAMLGTVPIFEVLFILFFWNGPFC